MKYLTLQLAIICLSVSAAVAQDPVKKETYEFLTSVASLAQSLPDLPQLAFDNFAPEIREQMRKAYAAAQARPREAETVGRLGMTLHTYEESEGAAVCYERARRLAPDEFRWVYYLGIVQAR